MQKILLALTVSLLPLWASGELSNRRAPGFSLPDMRLVQHDLADYRGSAVILEIMQTTCEHCAKFAPVLEEVSRKYAGRLQVLSVVNPPDTVAAVTKFMADYGVSFPILFDCGQASASYVMATPRTPKIEIPHIFLIDRQGYIRNDFTYGEATKGIFEGRDLFAEVDKLLALTGGVRKAEPKK